MSYDPIREHSPDYETWIEDRQAEIAEREELAIVRAEQEHDRDR